VTRIVFVAEVMLESHLFLLSTFLVGVGVGVGFFGL
jgi:hypothetical protein